MKIYLEYSWSIDPFGHSSAMAWASKELGFEGMVINRVHREIKSSWNKNQSVSTLLFKIIPKATFRNSFTTIFTLFK